MHEFDFKTIEEKWRRRWEEAGTYRTPESPRRKYYLLVMFAYPSGDIHMGHFRNYTIGDIQARYRMLQGFDVLHPFGWDAFGLPAEQAAIKRQTHPRKWTLENIETSRKTLQRMGISYDWNREVITCNPDYYRWTQWLFLLLFKRGLAYQAQATVNWCEQCRTILANEQAQGGKCWRCDGPVIKKDLDRSWYFKYSTYADRLLADLEKLSGWPERVRTMQRDWIGRSEGARIRFRVDGSGEDLPVFTTRPDTVYGVTFMAIAPEHPLTSRLAKGTPYEAKVREYADAARRKSEIDRTSEERERDGVFTGRYAVNPFSGDRIPIWTADYVIGSYGSGIVMGVPGHDRRDFAFAKKYGLQIRIVIQPKGVKEPLDPVRMSEAFVDEGIMVNSGPFEKTPSREGIDRVVEYGASRGFAEKTVQFRLRDWLVSRQRYWGCPIPIVHCPGCGTVPVPEDQLPVLLPENVDFLPKGRSPLEDCKEFIETACPACGGPAKRDADTMDTFMDSSFYQFRYFDPKNDREPWRKSEAETWAPIDLYIGGVEHACMHLLYFRFITKVLYEAGWVPCDEPATRLFNHGMVLDAQGQVMSKSKGNAVSPSELFDKWGVDVARLAMLFFAPSDAEIRWSEDGLVGADRFARRLWSFLHGLAERTRGVSKEGVDAAALAEPFRLLRRRYHQLLLRAHDAMESDLAFNTLIARFMEYLNLWDSVRQEAENPDENAKRALREIAEGLTIVLGPMAPFMAEEIWEALGGAPSLFKNARWPKADPAAAREEELEIPVQVNGKVRARIRVPADIAEAKLKEQAKEAAKDHIDGKPIAKIIVVKGRLVNIVTG